jgi:mannose-6-phosphate isomerase-like protein (cupin superfamily)
VSNPAGACTPGEEVGYILAGVLEMRIDGKPTLTVRTGDGVLIPRRTPLNALNLGSETGQMPSTYTVEIGAALAALT